MIHALIMENSPSWVLVMILVSSDMTLSDVEQTIHAFLKQQGRCKSQCKIKGGAVEAIGETVSELHEIL